jgi:hypothetical protein
MRQGQNCWIQQYGGKDQKEEEQTVPQTFQKCGGGNLKSTFNLPMGQLGQSQGEIKKLNWMAEKEIHIQPRELQPKQYPEGNL